MLRFWERGEAGAEAPTHRRRLIFTQNFFEKVEVFKRACRRLETAMAQSVEQMLAIMQIRIFLNLRRAPAPVEMTSAAGRRRNGKLSDGEELPREQHLFTGEGSGG